MKQTETRTITIDSGHGILESQDKITLTKHDDRWLIRFYFWIFNKGDPLITEEYDIVSIDSPTTFTIRKIK